MVKSRVRALYPCALYVGLSNTSTGFVIITVTGICIQMEIFSHGIVFLSEQYEVPKRKYLQIPATVLQTGYGEPVHQEEEWPFPWSEY